MRDAQQRAAHHGSDADAGRYFAPHAGAPDQETAIVAGASRLGIARGGGALIPSARINDSGLGRRAGVRETMKSSTGLKTYSQSWRELGLDGLMWILSAQRLHHAETPRVHDPLPVWRPAHTPA